MSVGHNQERGRSRPETDRPLILSSTSNQRFEVLAMFTSTVEGFVAISAIGSMNLLAGLLRAAKAAAQVSEDGQKIGWVIRQSTMNTAPPGSSNERS
jgi:hypothetical protein